MPSPDPEQRLVNLRDHSVEVYLPDGVHVLGPWESMTVTDVGAQVLELARRGLVEIRSEQAAAEPETPGPATPSRTRRPRKATGGTSGGA